MTGPIAAVFPGQGSQSVGMVKDLFAQFPQSRRFFEEASDCIGLDLGKLCLEGPDDSLQLTANAQPAILTTSYSWFRILQMEKGFAPMAAAGHSLGEYCALLCAGALELGDAVRLVRRRGELMQEAVPAGKGKMAALLGLDDDAARSLCEAASLGPDSLVVPANYNSPGQIVIAGHVAAVERAEQMALDKDSRFRARRVIPLKVSAPFHCPLMTPVADIFKAELKAITWKPIRFSVIANMDALPHESQSISDRLEKQIDHPVLWTQCVEKLVAMGMTSFVEPGPGRVLSGLVKRCRDGLTTISIDTFEEFKKFK